MIDWLIDYSPSLIFLQKVIAISVETGVQNTGIAIVLLRLSLPQPDADLAAVVPVCGSIMLFIPLFLWYCGLVLHNRLTTKGSESVPTTEEGSLDKFERGMGGDHDCYDDAPELQITPCQDEKLSVENHLHKVGNAEGCLKIFNGSLGGRQFSVPSSQQELLKGAV